jgi:hypothetical protein
MAVFLSIKSRSLSAASQVLLARQALVANEELTEPEVCLVRREGMARTAWTASQEHPLIPQWSIALATFFLA